MKIASLPLVALAVLPFSSEVARAPRTPTPAVAPAQRLARVAAADLEDVAEMRRLAELATRPDLSRVERGVLDARFAGRLRSIDARAHGDARAHRAHGAALLEASDLTARGLGLEGLSLVTSDEAVRARDALLLVADALGRIARRAEA